MSGENIPNTNSGHGHVWSRPDGLIAKCGGPAICRPCAEDLALVQHASAPIVEAFRETMNRTAEDLDRTFPGSGWVLLTFNFGQTEGGRVNYISNASRPEMITAMREWLARMEGRAVETPGRA